MKINPKILRAYDIRGVYGDALTTDDAYALGRLLATRLGNRGAICLGRDGRVSSPALAHRLTEGLQDGGMHVLDIGLVATPVMYFAVKTQDVKAGVMVTGSHNPATHNGFKITLKDRPFFGEDIRALNDLDAAPVVATPLPVTACPDVLQAYVVRLLQDAVGISADMRVAWDPGHGAGAVVLKHLIPHLPGQHFVINDTVDGTFPAHPPDPTKAENLAGLQQVVKEHACTLGIAFDGDADRIGVVDATGTPIPGDFLTLLFAELILDQAPDSKVIVDIKASRAVIDGVTAAGGELILWKTGHSIIKQKIAETGAILAGEMSGHIFINHDFYGFDDGVYAAMRLLREISARGLDLVQWRTARMHLQNSGEQKVACADGQKFHVVAALQDRLRRDGQDFIDIDGARVTTADGWWLVRASNTEPYLVWVAEAETPHQLDALKMHLFDYLTPLLKEIV